MQKDLLSQLENTLVQGSFLKQPSQALQEQHAALLGFLSKCPCPHTVTDGHPSIQSLPRSLRMPQLLPAHGQSTAEDRALKGERG